VFDNARLLWWGLTPRPARREMNENAVEAPEGRVNDIVVRRLGAADVELALDTFRLMADVFDEGGGPLSAEYAATHQRRGVGRRLVETLCSAAAAAGVSVAFVPADVEDEHAVAFYRALGGEAAPVTIFTFEQPAADRRAAS